MRSAARTSVCRCSAPWPSWPLLMQVRAASTSAVMNDAREKRAGKKKHARRRKFLASKESKRLQNEQWKKQLGPDALRADFCKSSALAWERFYESNNTYADRLWLNKDLPVLAKPGTVALEVGCGVGGQAYIKKTFVKFNNP